MAVLVIAARCAECGEVLPGAVAVGRCTPCRVVTLPDGLRDALQVAGLEPGPLGDPSEHPGPISSPSWKANT